MNPEQANPEEARKLESWKEIAAYLQRDVKTAHRWEKSEGLPVHRHSHKSRASVYAYPSEIDAWKQSRRVVPEPTPVAARPLWRIPSFALAILLSLMMVGNGIRPQAASAGQGKALAKWLLCSDCGDPDGDFTRDGRTMAFEDFASGDIGLRNMSTGQVTLLGARPQASQEASAESPVFSPDHRQIAYTWEPDSDGVQCRVMPNERGAKSRLLLGDASTEWCEVEAWTPDGKAVIAWISRPDHTTQFLRVSLSDGSVTALKSLEWRLYGVSGVSLSSDGRYLAYSARAINPTKAPPAPTDSKDIHIYTLATDGSSENEIVNASGANMTPVWTPDGRHILFTSDRSGKTDLWSIPVLNGKAAGAESLVSPETGPLISKGIYGGSLYYTHRVQAEYVHIADAASGATQAETFVGVRPAWSPDGKSVAFKRHTPGQPDQYNLVIRTLETGAERTYLTSFGTTGGGAPLWYHDGKSVLTGIKRSDGTVAAHRIDVASGGFTELPGVSAWRALSPDDKIVYEVRRAPGGKTPDHIIAVDLAAATERQIFESHSSAALATALSPDGRTLALGWRDGRTLSEAKLHIARVAVDGSGYREIYAIDQRFGASVLAWSGDGGAILFDQEQPDTGAVHWDVRRVPADGGPAVLAFKAGQAQNFDLSPNGSHFIYSANETAHELWALDNVLAALK